MVLSLLNVFTEIVLIHSVIYNSIMAGYSRWLQNRLCNNVLSVQMNVYLLQSLHPLNVSIKVCNSLHAGLLAVFSQSRGFGSTQVLDSKRYCILQRGSSLRMKTFRLSIINITITDNTYFPRESVVEPSLPIRRYSVPTFNLLLHWRLLANTRWEPTFTSTSPPDRYNIRITTTCVQRTSSA